MEVRSKKYTVSDVYQEAHRMLQQEMSAMKKRPLTDSEELKMKQLGKVISKMVLKEMNVI
jgi:hypothetical protein